ncbi:MAG: DUF2059 domain-containing protein [Opitutales bacterium]
MTFYPVYLFCLLGCLVAASPAWAQDVEEADEVGETPAEAAKVTSEEIAAARSLLEATGAAERSERMLGRMFRQLDEAMPRVNDSYWQQAREAVDLEAFVIKQAEIYAAHYTLDELEELTAFYESALGQRLLQEQTAIRRESLQLGQQWGEGIARRVLSRLSERGESFLEPAPEAAPDNAAAPGESRDDAVTQ